MAQRFARHTSPLATTVYILTDLRDPTPRADTDSLSGRVISWTVISTPEDVLVHLRKPRLIPLAEFVPWTTAHFQTEGIRDRFLCVAATLPAREVEVKPMLYEVRGALVRWRPGKFLGLNDIAYAHGGRIVVTAGHGHLSYLSQ